MRGYQARAHVGRGSLCVMLFTDWGCEGRRVSSLPRIPAQQRPPCLGSSPRREGLKVSGCRIDRNDLGLVFDASFRERRARRKALVGQITPDERIDRSGPPGLAPVSQEIADRQSLRLLPEHCDIGHAVAAQPHRRRQVHHNLPQIVDRPRRPACRRPEPRSRPARDSRSGTRVSIGPRTADAHRASAAGTNTYSGAGVSMTTAAPRCRPGGRSGAPPRSRRVLSFRGSRPWRPLAADSCPDSSRRCRC
jgi:hypothetical protein